MCLNKVRIPIGCALLSRLDSNRQYYRLEHFKGIYES